MSDLVAIGHVTRDELTDGGWRLGGGALYGAVTAARLGRSTALVTRVAAAEREALEDLCGREGIELHALPSLVTTTFLISYDDTGARALTLRARARGIAGSDLPAWEEPAAVIFASVAHELPESVFRAIGGRGRVLAAQGILREWSADGAVSARDWIDAERVLTFAGAVVTVSDDDLGGDLSIAKRWSSVAPVVVTLAERGACLYENGVPHAVAGFPAGAPVDPTGSGDAFAAGLALGVADGRPLREAVGYANAVASFAAEGAGLDGLADHARVAERLADGAR